MPKIFALLKYRPWNPIVEGDCSDEWSMVYIHRGEAAVKTVSQEDAKEMLHEFNMICVLQNNFGSVYELPNRSFAGFVKANEIDTKELF